MLLGRYGGNSVAEAIRSIITEDMLSHEHVEEFHTETYTRQRNDASTNYVKRLLNYFIDYRYRTDVIDALMRTHYPEEKGLAKEFYMSKAELAQMHQSGMILGSHTVNHPVMGKLVVDEQEREIFSSFQMLESITGETDLRTFCYPYGGFHTFTRQTEQLLEKHSCLFSFNVEPRDISQDDLASRRQALPRFDCNAFPYGACRNVEE